MNTTITLMGAGGKMGCRIGDNLRKTQYAVRVMLMALDIAAPLAGDLP